MKLWNWVEKILKRRAEIAAKMEVIDFVEEWGDFRDRFPSSLKGREERLCHKMDLMATYSYQEGDDLLSKKQDFIDQYTVDEREQLDFFTRFDRKNVVRCKAWRDHEQRERSCARLTWPEVVCRNQREHRYNKNMNQKTR